MWTTAVRLDLTLTHFWMNPVTIKDTRSQIKMLVRLSRCSCCCSVLQMMHNRANDLPSTFSYPQSWKIIPSRLQNAKTAPVTAITRVQLITCTPPPLIARGPAWRQPPVRFIWLWCVCVSGRCLMAAQPTVLITLSEPKNQKVPWTAPLSRPPCRDLP